MEMMNNFSKSTFGGFKKEEVVAYIDEVVGRYNDEISRLKEQDQSQKKQLKELKDIVEQQYQKIVMATQELTEKGKLCDELTRECETSRELLITKGEKFDNLEVCFKSITNELTEAKTQLGLVNSARVRANEIAESAKNHAAEIHSIAIQEKEEILRGVETMAKDAEIIAKEVVEKAENEAQEIVEKAEEEANVIKEKVLCQAKNILDSANEKMELVSKCEEEMINTANGHIENIKKKEQENIAKTRTIILENQAKAEEVIKSANSEASEIIAAATKQAEEIHKRAVDEYGLEREKLESLIKSIDIQKSSLLLSLDDIREKIQSIKIVKSPRANEPSVVPPSLAPSEIIRRRLSILGNKQ